MDVNQTIKINQLVKEFKKHGIATDEEAIKKASNIVERDVLKSEPQKTEQSKTGEQTMDDQSIMNIINRKVFYQAEQTEKKMKEEMDKVRAEMSTLTNEIKNLKNAVNTLASRPAPQTSGQQTLQQPQQAEPQPPKSKRGVDNEPVKPRTGDYKPGDVDINDIFNYGKK
jgi:predicted RNase H-like nuclease (RuvC/YqgF family)